MERAKNMLRRLSALLSAALLLQVLTSLAISSLAAHDGAKNCLHCQRHSACTKVCRLVCEEKKVEVTLWGCETEEFCVPGPSSPGGEHCESVDSKSEKGLNQKVCSQPKKFVWTAWTAGCAKVFTKKKLMKRTTTKTIPSYKWVVEDVCEKCQSQLKHPDKVVLDKLPAVPPEFSQLPLVIAAEPALQLVDQK